MGDFGANVKLVGLYESCELNSVRYTSSVEILMPGNFQYNI